MNLTFNTYYEQLLYEVGILQKVSVEPGFTSYLDTVKTRAAAAPGLSLELRGEVIRNFKVYAQNRQNEGRPIGSYMEYVYTGMDAPVVLEAARQAQPVQPAPQPVPQARPVMPSQPVQPAQPIQPAPQARPVMTSQQVPPYAAPMNAFQSTSRPVLQPVPQARPVMQGQPVQSAPQPVPQARPVMQAQPVYQAAPQHGYQAAQPAQKPADTVKKPGAEYAIGGILLSIFGTVLILTGFIMLAVNFFDSFWQGMCLFAVCAVLIAISELIIRRLVRKLSYVFTGLGISGFFVITLVNYYALELYNFWVAMALLLVFSVLTVVFARFKKSLLFNLIGYASCFVSLGLAGSITSEAQLITLNAIVLVELVLWMVFPAEEYTYSFNIISTCGTIVFLFSTITWSVVTDKIHYDGDVITTALSIFVAVNMIVLIVGTVLAGYRMFVPELVNGVYVKKKSETALIALYAVSSFFHIAFNIIYLVSIDNDYYVNMAATFSALAVLLAGIGGAYLLKRKHIDFWPEVFISTVFVASIWLYAIRTEVIYAAGYCLIGILVTLAARFLKGLPLKICDIVFKILYAFTAIYVANKEGMSVANYIMIAGLVIMIAVGSGYLIPSHIILTGTLIYCVCQISTYRLWLVLISGIVMLAVLVFHNVKWLKHKNILVFDIMALVTTVFVLGFLNHPFYKDDMISILLVFCFGLGILVQYLQKSYGMFFAGNMMPVAMYLSYFVFVLRLKEAFVTSAILMGVALVCVTLGFLMKQRAIRIYGLVLSLFVCLKLVIFDFASAASLVKTITYFVVGIIALGISGAYIIMEMQIQKKIQAEKEKEDSVQSGNNIAQ